MIMANEGGSTIPQATHPIARAFFDALDNGPISSKQSESLKRKSRSLGWRNRHSQGEFFPVAIGNTSFSVRQVQRGEIEGTYGTGATVWPAALVLMKYLEKHPILVRGKHVVDLGSGTGVTSVAAALLGASSVVCTDGEQSVVRLASENVKLAASSIRMQGAATSNAVDSEPASINKCPIAIRNYWWGDGSLKTKSCDLIIVADCVLPKLYPIAPLVQAIDELLTTSGAVAILSYEYRYYPEYDPAEKFRELATTRKLQVKVVEPSQLDPVYCVDDIEIWHVWRARED